MRASALAALLALAACGPLVQVGGNAPKPDVLYTLTADAAPASPPAGPRRIVLVGLPAVTGALQTLRVPVQVGDTRLQYLTGAQWVEPPARLLQRLMIDRFAAAGLTAVAPGVTDSADTVATGTLRTFGLDARTSGQFRAVARLDAALTGPDGRLIAARTFEAAEPIPDDQPRTVVEGLNRAANRLAGEMAAWAAQGR